MTAVRPDAATCQAVLQALVAVGEAAERLNVAFRSALDLAFPVGHPLRRGIGQETDAAALVLGSMVEALRSGQDRPEAVEAVWQRLGASWAAQGVTTGEFALVGQLWFRAVRQICSDVWSSSVSSGWAALDLWMLHHLGHGSALVAAVPLPAPQLAQPDPSPTGDARTAQERGAAAEGADPAPRPGLPGHKAGRRAGPAHGSDLYKAWGRSWT